MSRLGQARPVRTDYGRRLASRKEIVRAAAEAELAALGAAAAGKMLRAELRHYEAANDLWSWRMSATMFLALVGLSLAEQIADNLSNAHPSLRLLIGGFFRVVFVAATIAVAVFHNRWERGKRALRIALLDIDDTSLHVTVLLELWVPQSGRPPLTGEERLLALLTDRLNAELADAHRRWNGELEDQRYRQKLEAYYGRRPRRRPLPAPSRDLSPVEADLLVTIIRLLGCSETNTDTNRRLLRRIAAAPATLPHWRFVSDTADALLRAPDREKATIADVHPVEPTPFTVNNAAACTNAATARLTLGRKP